MMRWLGAALALCLIPAFASAAPPAPGTRTTPEARGEYLLRAAGGCSCHTNYKADGAWLAGGKPIKTPFGTFYGTNITPDPDYGLGRWSEADFVRAMTEGVGPQGQHYFPVFPYTSFTHMTREDLADLWAYLRSVKPVARPNTPHDVLPPFGWRFGAGMWKRMFFTPGTFQPDPKRSAAWNRGAYLVTGPSHCGECHTPRNLAGAPKPDMFLAGSRDGPEGQLAPNVTPHRETGIGDWSDADIVWLLQTGGLPSGDQVEGLMAEVIDNGYGKLTRADLEAMVVYLRSVPPIRNKLVKRKQ